MTEEKGENESGEISRREFLKDAGLVVGGAAIGSTVLLAACGDGEVTTETVTQTQTQTETVTTTQQVGEVTTTVTETETVSKFICPIDGMEFDTLAALQAHFAAEHPAEVVPEKLTKLTINGSTYELQVEPNWTLADVLREKLHLTGTKIGCDEGACGSCTVLVGGKANLACMMLAVEVEGKDILTIEGLSDGIELHPIQQAFWENYAVQCGFCTPGMIMTAKALLDANANPTKEEVKKALSGNICKCSCYIQAIDAVLAAA